MPPLGILTLEGKMADVPGMMGSDATWKYPVRRHVVAGSTTPMSATDAARMAPLYVSAAQELARDGVRVITANCGLMALAQREVASAVPVPVVMSSLVAVPAIARMLAPRQPIGILTFFEDAVGEENFAASGWSSEDHPVHVAGVGHSEAWAEFLATKELDRGLRCRLVDDLRETVRTLLRSSPDVGALVSECTMLPAVLGDLRPELNLPVFDLPTVLDWTVSAVTGRDGQRVA